MIEQCFRKKEGKQRVRPFQEEAEVYCRGYSKRLERILVDFGADESFAGASCKVKEHYGIEISASGIRKSTYKHSHQIVVEQKNRKPLFSKESVDCIISQSDGAMVPIVEITKGKGDDRKRRQLFWKEAISTLAYRQGSVTPFYAATLEGRIESSTQMKQIVLEAGMGEKTRIHAVGDGATWIAEQVEFQFGTQASFLIDFYHLCDYLSAAIESADIKNKKVYMGRVKSLLRQGKAEQAVRWLKKFQEAEDVKNENAPVRAFVRYITNRPGQFEYQKAIEQNLPIGSGKIESTHRHLIQKRLKISGAWWKKENANRILALRVLRANYQWEQYWSSFTAA